MKARRCTLFLLLVACSVLLAQPTTASSTGRATRNEPPFYYMLLLTTNVSTAPILLGSGLYRLNSIVTFKAPPTLIGLGGVVVHFSNWKGDYVGNSTVGDVTITGDMFIMAVYK